MIKTHALLFTCLTICSVYSASLLAKETLMHANQAKNDLCENKDVNVFSCHLESGENISVCANDNPPSLRLLVKTAHHLKSFTLNNPHQLFDNGAAWQISIIKTSDVNPPVNLFLYIGNVEPDEYSAIQYSGKTGICKEHTTFTGSINKTRDSQEITLFNLTNLNVTSSLFSSDDEKEQSDIEKKLIDSWPSRK